MAATYVKPGELGLNPEKLTEMLTELEQTVEIPVSQYGLMEKLS